MEFAAGFALTVLSSGIWLVAGYVKLYLPSEEQYGMQPCGVPGTVEKPCWGPAFTSGCRLPLCPAQPLPPQLLTNLPHCVLTWFVMARITSYNGSALCLGLNDILMVTSFLEGSFCRSCHISPTLRTACWLSCLSYDFPKVDSDGVLHSMLAVLVGMAGCPSHNACCEFALSEDCSLQSLEKDVSWELLHWEFNIWPFWRLWNLHP